MFCDGFQKELASLFNTIKLYLGGLGLDPKTPVLGSHVPEYMQQANVAFIKQALGWTLEERPIKKV